MQRVFFHCTGPSEVLVDQEGSVSEHFGDMQAQASVLVNSLIAGSGPEDWRDWMVHVSDEDGEDLFVVPFTAVLGRPH